MSPAQKQEDVVARTLAFWEHREEYGRPVGCITTTYTFDAGFFEEECLTRFAGIDSDPSEERTAYIVEREEKLSEVFACVFVDQSHVRPERSLRWELLPVRVPGGGIQHAKVALLVWEQQIRLLIGSGNVTVPGCQRNFENTGKLDFTPSGETPLALLREALEFIEMIRRYAPGDAAAASAGPQLALRDFLKVVRKMIQGWETREWERNEPQVALVLLGPRRASLFEQIRDRIWSGTRADAAWILSPFFDHGDEAKATVESLVGVMGRRGIRQLHFMGSGIKLPDKSVDLDMPEVFRDPWLFQTEHYFLLIKDRDSDGNSRRLHAKSLWIESEEEAVYLIGSSNFTAAGTGTSATRKNLEANLAYRLPRGWTAFQERCEKSYPPYETIELTDRVRFMQSLAEATPEPEGFAPLPIGFGEALFQPEGTLGTLLLHIDGAAPSEFSVETEEKETITGARGWREQGTPSLVRCPWRHPKPPSALIVSWVDTSGTGHRSWWIVNVTDASQLPAPAELRDLPLQLLLEILTSARPLHEALARATKARSAGSRISQHQLDPHRRVDTSQYLLKRVKRVSVALEGLRSRLERPVFSLEALRWRLEGPVGPLALARRIAAEEPRAAAFLIAELGLLLKRVNWAPHNATLGGGVVSSEIDKTVRTLRDLAAGYPTARDVESYVQQSFEIPAV